MSRTYDTYLMQQYGDLELGNEMEVDLSDVEMELQSQREREDQMLYSELHEAEQDLILGLTENVPEFFWNA